MVMRAQDRQQTISGVFVQIQWVEVSFPGLLSVCNWKLNLWAQIPRVFYLWRTLCLDIWLCTGVSLLGCKIGWKMSILGEKAQVSCETALGGTKAQVFTAWLPQGNCILKHLWINLCKQMWVFLANCPSTHIHCAICKLGVRQVMVPPKSSPTATPTVYPKYNTPCSGFAA